MTSFGFSLGDIALVCKCAASVVKQCKNAGENFRGITADIETLRSLLNTLDNECKSPASSLRYLPLEQQGQLVARLQDCEADLRSVETILSNFRSLDTHHARYRDKLKFTRGKQANIREKIVAHSDRLQLLLHGYNFATLSRIERNTEVQWRHSEVQTKLLLSLKVKIDEIRKDSSPCRRNAPKRASSGDALALENKTQKAITSGRRNAPKRALSGDRLALQNKAQKAITSGRPSATKRALSVDGLALGNKTQKAIASGQRNASEHAVCRGGSSSKNSTSKNSTSKSSSPKSSSPKSSTPKNSTPKSSSLTNHAFNNKIKEIDFDSSFEVGEWHDEGSKENLRPAKKRSYPFRRPQVKTDVSCRNSKPSPSIEKAEKVTNNTTVALVTHDDKKLTTAQDFPSFGEAYYYEQRNKRWMRTVDRTHRTLEDLSISKNTFYILECSYEELCLGASRRIDVKRRTSSTTGSYEEISLNVQIDKGYSRRYAIQYHEAGDESAEYTESLVFVITAKNHKLFARYGSDLAYDIQISIAEAIDGWSREVRHPNGKAIELYADGPTNVWHSLEMEDYGLPWRDSPGDYGRLFLWIYVTDIKEASADQLDELDGLGTQAGVYFARIRGERGQKYESNQEHSVDFQDLGGRAMEHRRLLGAEFGKRKNDLNKSPHRRVALPEAKRRPRS